MSDHFPPAAEKIVADYLEKLQAHLKGMNEKDRQEVLAEIRSHLFESFAGDGEGDEIDRALRALKRLGEPADVVSSRVGASVAQMGRKKKSLLYILAGSLIVLFAAPLGMGGLASTGRLCLVLSWNEAFWSLNLSAAKAGTLATLIASYSSPEGLFWAKLSAASLMAIAPIVVFGWFSQKQLVQGLTFGAVK